MAVPLILSDVPSATPYIQYVATGGQVSFPYPFPITQDSDLIVVVNGITLNTDAGYSLTGQGDDTGGNAIFTLAPGANAIITLYRDIVIERISQIAQNSGFSSTVFNAEFNNIYLIMQQLEASIAQCLQIPNTNNPLPTTVLTPAIYANKYLSFDANGNPTPAVLTSSGVLTAAIIGGLIYPKSALEIAGSFNPTQLQYPYGCPRRFGAVGTGASDDTAAVQNAHNSATVYWAWPGDGYSVLNVVAGPNLSEVYFNGSELVGNATTAQNCVYQIQTNFCSFYDIAINGGSYLGVNPNSNYTCLAWWYRSGAASQFNSIYGIELFNANRGMVYGGLPGNSSTTVVHSENKIYGFQSTGVSNPMYVNSSTGFVHCYGSTFFRDASSWTTPTLPSTARAYEVVVGNLYIHGGEVIASNSLVGFATEGSAIADGVYFELSAALHITQDNGRFTNCRFNVLNQGVNLAVVAASTTGVLAFNGCTFLRPSGTGATDRTSMIDGTLATTFEVDLNNSTSFEWGFGMSGQNCKLINGCVARYANHRLQITDGTNGGDSNIYIINTPRLSILAAANAAASTAGQPAGAIDSLGYTTDGWVLNTISGGGTTLTVTTNAGPTNYLASQLTLHATGQAYAVNGDSTSLATLKTSALRVRPAEHFWLSAWMNASTGTSPNLIASFYDITGAAISVTKVADVTGIGSATWVFAEGPLTVPASAAYMLVGVEGVATDIQFTDLRLQRA